MQKTRLKNLKAMIEGRLERKNAELGAKINNKLIDQVIIATLLNSHHIKEMLANDYQKIIDGK